MGKLSLERIQLGGKSEIVLSFHWNGASELEPGGAKTRVRIKTVPRCTATRGLAEGQRDETWGKVLFRKKKAKQIVVGHDLEPLAHNWNWKRGGGNGVRERAVAAAWRGDVRKPEKKRKQS